MPNRFQDILQKMISYLKNNRLSLSVKIMISMLSCGLIFIIYLLFANKDEGFRITETQNECVVVIESISEDTMPWTDKDIEYRIVGALSDILSIWSKENNISIKIQYGPVDSTSLEKRWEEGSSVVGIKNIKKEIVSKLNLIASKPIVNTSDVVVSNKILRDAVKNIMDIPTHSIVGIHFASIDNVESIMIQSPFEYLIYENLNLMIHDLCQEKIDFIIMPSIFSHLLRDDQKDSFYIIPSIDSMAFRMIIFDKSNPIAISKVQSFDLFLKENSETIIAPLLEKWQLN